MPRYIDADELEKCSYVIAYKDEWHMTKYGEFVELADIENAPTADVRENVHAEWLPYEFGTKRWHKCSACGIADEYINEKGLEARREFCPHCGAQMDKRRRIKWTKS